MHTWTCVLAYGTVCASVNGEVQWLEFQGLVDVRGTRELKNFDGGVCVS